MERADQKVVLALKGIDGFKHVNTDDFVISLRSFQGGIERCLYSGCVSPAYTVLRASRPIDPAYWAYLLKSGPYISALVSATDGIREGKTISFDQFGTIGVPVPALNEQTAIAAFLDRETGKIDALVDEQRRLIELLQEKRQAVISHAVTKGLNPDAPMRDSGIEGTANVPKHWEVTVIKRFSTLQRGHDLTDAERTEGPYPVVTSGGISGTHGSFMAHGPGVVTGRYGSTGKLFFIEEDFWPHNTSLYVIDFHGNHARFVWYALQTIDFAAHSAKAAVPGIDRNDIHVLPVVVPPSDEQLAIAAFLDAETACHDLLIAEATRAIDLLQERRTALISAAVTGKIDVRGLATEDAA
jgi:type I restriction enzyme S subunit